MLYYIEFAIFEQDDDSEGAIRREDEYGRYFAVYRYLLNDEFVYDYAHEGDLSYTRF